ncbi:hypothetical protein ACN28S_33600 [Cystobacter fuscus]
MQQPLVRGQHPGDEEVLEEIPIELPGEHDALQGRARADTHGGIGSGDVHDVPGQPADMPRRGIAGDGDDGQLELGRTIAQSLDDGDLERSGAERAQRCVVEAEHGLDQRVEPVVVPRG